jgi:DNA polymerase-3 subunit gamma/tau
LALIKLCYLQQALQLSSDGGPVSKKKIVDSVLPLAFRQITPIEVKKTAGETFVKEAKLVIETSESIGNRQLAIDNRQQAIDNKQSSFAEASADKQAMGNKQELIPTPGKLSPLEKIRKQMKGNGNGENGNGHLKKPLQLEELQNAWNEFTGLLKEAGNSAWQGFDIAELKLQDGNNFIAFVFDKIQFRFIEQEGWRVTQFLREKLQNNQLQFLIVMQENKEALVDKKTPLTAREQYQKMIEEYPLVKELKERLRLELDY